MVTQASLAFERGHRLLPAVLDYAGTHTPDNVYASVLRSSNIADGFRDVTSNNILRAVDSFAWWLKDCYGSSDSFETLAYVGVSDLRYTVFFYAAVKCGYKALFVSPRNPIHQNVSLLQQTRCSKFFHSPEFKVLASGLQGAMSTEALQVSAIGPLEEWIASYDKSYPYQKSFEQAKDDPIVIVHSSGSTGSPKPITQTHSFFANVDLPLPPVPGRVICGRGWGASEYGECYFSPFPSFHLMGFYASSVWPVFMQPMTLVMGLTDRAATAQMVYEILRQKELKTLQSPSSIIEQLTLMPEAFDLLKRLNTVVYTGGPLAKSCGDALVKHVNIRTLYGSTEIGSVPSLYTDSNDWDYLEFHPAFKVRMEPAIDGTSEFIVDRDVEADQYRGIGGTLLREFTEFRSKDLFMPHPSKQNLWRFYGRNDDIIVFSNGEKWNPIPSENIISEHPKLSGVLIAGDSRFQPVALLEPRKPIESVESLIEEVWPLVDRANKQSQRHGQLVRSKVVVIDPNGLVRAPKGTIVRSMTVKKWQNVLEKAYSDIDDEATAATGPSPYESKESLLQFVRSSVNQVLVLNHIGDDEDFFILGLDSLRAIELARILKSGLLRQFKSQQLSFITTQLIFNASSVTKLLGHISQTVSREAIGGDRDMDSDQLSAMANKYREKIKSLQPADRILLKEKNLQIVLTGSTGSLGRHLLHVLLESPNVTSVICLNRNPDAKELARQALSFSKSSFSKAVFKTVKFDKENFGLGQDELKVFAHTDAILHNAWKVDFNHPLSSFEPQIGSVAEFIRLAAANPGGTRIFFVSSISAVSNYSMRPAERRSESIYEDDSIAAPMGYGQSKQAAERVLGYAASNTGVPVSILRIGQIAGAVETSGKDGNANSVKIQAWNENEWVPALIKTSRNLGILPSEGRPVDWIPINKLASIISEITMHDLGSEEKLLVHNLVNPHPVRWQSLVPGIKTAITFPTTVVPSKKWISALKEHNSESTEEVKKYPALKILPFFEELNDSSKSLIFATDRAMKASSTFASLDPIKDEWMREWIHQWGY